MKAKNQISQISHLLDNGSQVNDPVKMANIFNKFFVNVGPNVDKSVSRTKKSSLDFLKDRNPNSMFLAPVTPQEIETIIRLLNIKKSIGPYSIPVFLLKILSRHIAQPLAKLVNLSFETGIFPDKLKVGKVNPLYKKGTCDNLSNYRPISILSVFSKIFEKLMYQRLYKFLELVEILYPLQFGFRENHSTTQALLSLTESIKSSIDNGKFGCGIFLDLQKAFDTVNHEILLQKLEHYGIRGNVLCWFQSYLSGRTQYVTVNGHVSDLLPITCGVPQGSVLGPLLFLIYVNDLPKVSKVMQFYLFADDTSIYFDSNNLVYLQKIVNRELKKIKKWLEANRLALNIDKTNYVIFHSPTRKIEEFVKIKLGSKPITRVNYIKYLGVLVDATLSWKPHITELTKKLARTFGIFYKIRHYVSPDTLKLLYYSLFYSFISYGITVWGLTHPSYMDPLWKLQKKVIRTIAFKDKYAHTTPLFHEFKMLKLADVHSLKLLCFVFDCSWGSSIEPFNKFFTPLQLVHSYNTRQSSKGNLFISSVNTTQFGKRSAKYVGATLWNNLPPSIREIRSSRYFKKQLSEFYLCSYS